MPDDRWRGLLPTDVVREAMSPIYHYTSPAGLLGLVEKRELWATEASGMNDVAEVRQGWDFIRRWLNDQDQDDEVVQEMQHVAGVDDDDKYLHPVRSLDGVFMCCASLRGDDANQWRLYASSARGYAVELDPRVPLTTLLDGQRPASPTHDGTRKRDRQVFAVLERVPITPWLHVLYTDVEKSRALDGLRARAVEERQRLLSEATAGGWDPSDYDAERQAQDDGLAFDLARVAQLMKSEGFSGEDEVRVVVSDAFIRTARFRATPYGIVRYSRIANAPSGHLDNKVAYEAELGRAKSLPIRSVRLGPLLNAQNNRETVVAFLEANGFANCAVTTSAVPLGH